MTGQEEWCVWWGHHFEVTLQRRSCCLSCWECHQPLQGWPLQSHVSRGHTLPDLQWVMRVEYKGLTISADPRQLRRAAVATDVLSAGWGCRSGVTAQLPLLRLHILPLLSSASDTEGTLCTCLDYWTPSQLATQRVQPASGEKVNSIPLVVSCGNKGTESRMSKSSVWGQWN